MHPSRGEKFNTCLGVHCDTGEEIVLKQVGCRCGM